MFYNRAPSWLRNWLGTILPLILLASVVTHHHDRLGDADHCAFCAAVGACRRRELPTEKLAKRLTPGGRPPLRPVFSVSGAQNAPSTAVAPGPAASPAAAPPAAHEDAPAAFPLWVSPVLAPHRELESDGAPRAPPV